MALCCYHVSVMQCFLVAMVLKNHVCTPEELWNSTIKPCGQTLPPGSFCWVTVCLSRGTKAWYWISGWLSMLGTVPVRHLVNDSQAYLQPASGRSYPLYSHCEPWSTSPSILHLLHVRHALSPIFYTYRAS